jgi:hypothetical protein
VQRLAAGLLTLVCALTGLAAVNPPSTAAKTLITARVYPHERGRAVPHSFLGVSAEWQGLWTLTGIPASGPNGVYDQLLANLAAYGGGPPTLRVGGNSQDSAWWNPDNLKSPYKSVFLNITPLLLQQLGAHVNATGQKLIMGVNLGANDPKLAAAEARAFTEYVPRRAISAFEIGNEPDSFSIRTAYERRDANGRRIERRSTRPRGYKGSTYLREYDRIARAVRRVAPRVPLAGTGGYGTLIHPRTFIKRQRKRLGLYTEHAYPMTGCAAGGQPFQAGDKDYPTLGKLLGKVGATTTMAQERRGIAAAHRFRKRYVVDELNSVACNSRQAVSASFGTALWAVDYLFIQAGVGVDGVNIHYSDPLKSPFRFRPLGDNVWQGFADPLYWGMLAFARAAGDRGHILAGTTLGARPGFGGKANAHVWAVRQGRQLRFMVVNKDLRRSGIARIVVPGSRRSGGLARLTAPSVTARDGISFGGQTIAGPTRDGRLEGSFREAPVRPRHGVYTFNMPRASAALLTIR